MKSSLSISGHIFARPLWIVIAIWLLCFLAPHFLVCLVAPLTIGMTINGGVAAALRVATCCSIAQIIGIVGSLFLAYIICFIFPGDRSSDDSPLGGFGTILCIVFLSCIFSIVSMVGGDFYVFKFFQSINIISGTPHQLLLAGGAASSLAIAMIAVAWGSMSRLQLAEIVSGRRKEAMAIISEAKEMGIETRPYEDVLHGKENELDRLNIVIGRLGERKRLAASIGEAEERGIETAPYEAALVAFELNISKTTLVPLVNCLTKRKFIADKLSTAKKRGIDTTPYEEALAVIEHSIECHQNLIAANDQLASLLASIVPSRSAPTIAKGFVGTYQLIDGGALIKVESPTSEALQNDVDAPSFLTYKVNLPSNCNTSPGSRRPAIAALLVYAQSIKMLDIHIYCPPSSIFGLRTEQPIDDWVHKWIDAMRQCDSSFTELPSVETISLGSLIGHKINWATTKGRAFAILCKDGPCVVEMSSLLTNNNKYDSNQIPVAEEIALSFRKQ